MNRRQKRLAALLLSGAVLIPVGLLSARRALSSDHADTPQIAASPGTDLTDVFVFPSQEDANKVVLAMCVHPLIPTGGSASFDPNVLYQFKIDNTGDRVEDLVIQATFTGTGAGQTVHIAGPARPAMTGTQSSVLAEHPTLGTINRIFSPATGMRVFAGLREDPFFFDLEQFFTILPDRGSPVFPSLAVPLAEANVPKAASWRAAGVAKDFLIGYNLLALAVEVPKSALRGPADGKIAVWCTTSK